jgi:hypothetical protein
MSDFVKPRLSRTRFRELFPALPKEHAAALGQVAASWSIVEAYCGQIIRCMYDTDGAAGHALVTEMPLLLRMSIIGTLINLTRDAQLAEHWEGICPVMNTLRSQRNDAIHAQWEAQDEQAIIIRTKAKGRLIIRWEPVPVEELIELDGRIMELVDDLGWFVHRLARLGWMKAVSQGLLQGSPETGRAPSRKAQAQARAREAKKARQQADRERAKAQPPKR